jgi:hypothetical protein
MKLSEVDRVYQAVRNEMSVNEKITYCSRLIYRTHLQLTKMGAHLTKESKQRSMEILQHARYELDELIRSNV